jgi:tRNA (guanosine-2'-O-)-methyltransferase
MNVNSVQRAHIGLTHCHRLRLVIHSNAVTRSHVKENILSLHNFDLLQSHEGHVDVESVIKMFEPFMMEGRKARIIEVIEQRTFSILPVVEGLYNMGNLAAVCRSADAMGFGAVHCIDSLHGEYKQSTRTSAGADKWINLRVWEQGTTQALTAIKSAGYQLIVTHLSKDAVPIQVIDWTRPTAFVLGNEKMGVSEEAVALADQCAIIPMAGFVESFNISVAAALIMYEAHNQRVRKLGKNGDLTEEEQKKLRAFLMMRSVREGPTLLKELLDRPPRFWQERGFKKAFQQERASS